jgi:dienelactone hydrolase
VAVALAARPLLLLLAGALVALAAGCGGGSEPADEAGAPFAYDDSRPLSLRLGAPNGVVREVSYASPAGGRVRALLVVPRGRGPFPAVLYLHGAGGTRRQFLPDAKALAARGVAGLLLDSAWVRASRDSPSGLAGVRRFRDLETATVVEARRGVDVLRALPRIDGRRLGFVGWSAGARHGAILAGVEPRLRALVLVAGGAAPVSAYVDAAPAELRRELEALLTSVDPLRFVAQARPGTVLFQLGLRDEVVPRDALERLAAAAPSPQRVRRYDAPHRPTPAMERERDRWLLSRLGR